MRLNRSSWVFVILIAWIILLVLTELTERKKHEKRVENGKTRSN